MPGFEGGSSAQIAAYAEEATAAGRSAFDVGPTGLLGIALQNGAAGNPPKHPRQVLVRQSRRTGRTLWRCGGGGRCTGRTGIGHTWEGACAQVVLHFKNTSHDTEEN